MPPRAHALATQSNVERQVRDGRGVYVKQFLTGGWQQTEEIVRSRILREIDLLARMQSAWPCGADRLGRVACVEADPQRLSMTLTEAPGELLLDALVRASRWHARSISSLPALLAGRWLSAFQKLPHTPADAAPLNDDPDDLIEYCDLRLTRLQDWSPDWMTATLRRRVLSDLQAKMAQASALDRRRVWSHGDFYPGNVLWDGRTLTPIDLSMCRLDYPLADLTYFVHSLYVLRMQFPWGRWPVRRWEAAILRGFGQTTAGVRQPMYQALMIRQMLCKLTGLARDKSTGAAVWHNRWIQARARSRLGQLLTA